MTGVRRSGMLVNDTTTQYANGQSSQTQKRHQGSQKPRAVGTTVESQCQTCPNSHAVISVGNWHFGKGSFAWASHPSDRRLRQHEAFARERIREAPHPGHGVLQAADQLPHVVREAFDGLRETTARRHVRRFAKAGSKLGKVGPTIQGRTRLVWSSSRRRCGHSSNRCLDR